MPAQQLMPPHTTIIFALKLFCFTFERKTANCIATYHSYTHSKAQNSHFRMKMEQYSGRHERCTLATHLHTSVFELRYMFESVCVTEVTAARDAWLRTTTPCVSSVSFKYVDLYIYLLQTPSKQIK